MNVRFNGLGLVLTVLLLTLSSGDSSGAGPENIQALVGAAQFESGSLTFVVPAEGEPGSTRNKDLDTMPCLGVTGQYPLAGDASQIGVEAGAFFGWRSRETDVFIGSGGTAVKIDSDLWLLDLSAGLYFSHMAGSGWRFFLGGGPLMVFGEYEEDGTEPGEEGEGLPGESDSEFGVGAYARAGIEYQYTPGALIGFSVRGLTTNLQFDSTVGDEKVKGLQAFVTFTALWPGRNYGWDGRH